MGRKLISSGSRFEAEIGYSRAVVDGNWVFVSGTTGYDYDSRAISDDPVKQADQCFRNIENRHSCNFLRTRLICTNLNELTF